MRMCFTSESTILPNAAPMITPTARSITLPFRAKFLNSSSSDSARRAGSTAPSDLSGSMSLSWVREEGKNGRGGGARQPPDRRSRMLHHAFQKPPRGGVHVVLQRTLRTAPPSPAVALREPAPALRLACRRRARHSLEARGARGRRRSHLE